MNKKVWNNLERLKAIAAQNLSKAEILDALHPWRLSINLKFNNTFAILQFTFGLALFFIGAYFLFAGVGWTVILWFIALAICGYAYFSFEKPSDITQVIKLLEDQVFQDQYQVKFNHFPHVDKNMLNPTHMLMRIRQGFECLNEGNAGNHIESIASTTWHVDGHDYPVLLFHYKAINETVIRDQNGNQIKKQTAFHRYGACIFDLPPLALMISTTASSSSNYPIKWSTSDIQFNRKFNIAGQQELELARNLTPQRILAIAEYLDHMRGSIIFHYQMNACCYVSHQNIFDTLKPKNPITDISMLRGYLRTLKSIEYERLQHSLTAIIRQFKDEDLTDNLNKKS